LQESERGDLINSLVIYGLSPVQAQTYITLLKLGRSTAKSISINSDVNRVDVYRAVKRLSKLGLIEQELGSPIAFVAVEPEQALDILVDAKSSQVERLRSGKTHLKRTLESLELERPTKSDLAEDEELFVKVLSGEQVFRRLKSLITNSREEVMAVFSPKSLVLYDRIGIPELEQERIAEGVQIRAVTSITKENCREASSYSKVVDLRHSDQLSSHLRYTIMDRSVLLLPVADPPVGLGDATALWTDSNALISGLIDDFEKLWVNSISFDERITKLHVKL
jgi:sugar-specific transcriptional regulator TrmB